MTVGDNRGYLKTSGSSKRLRFVQSGYDATDESTPPNKVIFDSGNLATLAVLEVGQYTWTNIKDTGGLVKVRTWDYGFVPLCMFQWSNFDDDTSAYDYRTNAQLVTELVATDVIKVATDGIYVSLYYNAFSSIPQIDLFWTAFAIDARDGA